MNTIDDGLGFFRALMWCAGFYSLAALLVALVWEISK
jgi:uncharacterized MAPEG superfamily protein